MHNSRKNMTNKERTSITHCSIPVNKEKRGWFRGFTPGFLILVAVLLLFSMPGPVYADDDGSGNVAVTTYSVDPDILIRGDTALVTITVTNNGNSSVEITDGQLISKEITVLNHDTYNTMRRIAPGSSIDFTFTIVADRPDGIYYPVFYLNFPNGSLKYTIPVRVEEAQLSLSAVNIPDPFVQGRSDDITLLIGNPKNVPITGVQITPAGEGMVFNQSSYFVGQINAHNSTRVQFRVTPAMAGDIVFNITYWSGINSHVTSLTIPVLFGEDKRAADPVISNVEITQNGGSGMISGDISNAGIEYAYALIVSLATPDADENPNSRYVIGTLEPDDFSSFELALPSGTGREVPLRISFKDEDGNVYLKNTTINQAVLSQGTGMPGTGSGGPGEMASRGSRGPGFMGNFGAGIGRIPVYEIGAGILVLVILILGYRYIRSRRKNGGFKIRIKTNRD